MTLHADLVVIILSARTAMSFALSFTFNLFSSIIPLAQIPRYVWVGTRGRDLDGSCFRLVCCDMSTGLSHKLAHLSSNIHRHSLSHTNNSHAYSADNDNDRLLVLPTHFTTAPGPPPHPRIPPGSIPIIHARTLEYPPSEKCFFAQHLNLSS
jgi:hypothetical protein